MTIYNEGIRVIRAASMPRNAPIEVACQYQELYILITTLKMKNIDYF